MILALGLHAALAGKTPEQLQNTLAQQTAPQIQTPHLPPSHRSQVQQNATKWSPRTPMPKWRPQLLFRQSVICEMSTELKSVPLEFLGDDSVFLLPQQLVCTSSFFKESMHKLLQDLQPMFLFDARDSQGNNPTLIQDRINLHESIVFESIVFKGQSDRSLDRSPEWELQLLPPRGSNGKLRMYVYRRSWLAEEIQKRRDVLLNSNKLPLVLDLDDTILRAVGNDVKKVPVNVAQSEIVKHRLKTLSTGTQVVLAEGLEEFLDWASKKFEISLCSLGDDEYVNSIKRALDPTGTRITGIAYSARFAYDALKLTSGNKQPTPKDLTALYSFCYLAEKYSLPLIIEDTKDAWVPHQVENIIEVAPDPSSEVWTVWLLPHVKDVLQHVHTEFFRAYAITRENPRLPTPSAVTLYHEYLRGVLRQRIATRPSSQSQ